MARAGMLHIFTDELPIKLLAMVLAVTLFVIVRSDKDAQAGAYVKVLYTLPDDRVLVSDAVAEVRVGVRGPWTRLQRFDEREIDPIRLDLTHSEGGQQHLSEDMVKVPPGLRVVSLTPSEVQVKFEPRQIRSVPVQPLLEGEPADGFRVARVSSQPETVRVDGAKSVVENLKRVPTRPLRIAGARGTVRGEVALEPPPNHTRFDGPTHLVVEASVVPAIIERTVEGLVVRPSGHARMDGDVTPDKVRVVLRGPSDVLTQVPLDQVSASIDMQLEDARGPASYKKRVAVSGLPAGVAAEVQPDTVTLSTHRHHD